MHHRAFCCFRNRSVRFKYFSSFVLSNSSKYPTHQLAKKLAGEAGQRVLAVCALPDRLLSMKSKFGTAVLCTPSKDAVKQCCYVNNRIASSRTVTLGLFDLKIVLIVLYGMCIIQEYLVVKNVEYLNQVKTASSKEAMKPRVHSSQLVSGVRGSTSSLQTSSNESPQNKP